MPEPLREILERAELHGFDVFTRQDVRAWPPGVLAQLVGLGILREIGRADGVEYDGCDEPCFIRAEFVEHPDDGRPVCLHRCRNGCGRVLVEAEEFDRWQFDLGGLAGALAPAIEATGAIVVDVPGRLALVGMVSIRRLTREVFVAAGLRRDDAASVLARAARLKASPAPLVLTVGAMPNPTVWPSLKPAVAVLAEHLRLGPRGLELAIEPLLGLETIPHSGAKATEWITSKQAAILLQKDLNIDHAKAKARVSKAASEGKHFKTNGETGTARRIDADSFAAWRIKQRDADLAREDAPAVQIPKRRLGALASSPRARSISDDE